MLKKIASLTGTATLVLTALSCMQTAEAAGKFAWQKDVKGPRVVHVTICPVGADADDPKQRFKMLGTSAFYRRYRQGTLAADGTWTPFLCPDENLWERLFPPTEPVDYGWVTTGEAFRLVSEEGRPDVKTTLPPLDM